MTLPSFFAASISCGVTALAGGAADVTEAKAPDAARAVEPLSTSRRENCVIAVSSLEIVVLNSSVQDAAALGRQMEPYRGALGYVLPGRRNHAQLGAITHLHQIVAA